MNLYPLSNLPKVCAQLHADIHLRQGIIACAKIISDSIHLNVKHIPLTIREDGSIEYFLESEKLFPPPRKQFDAWARWAAGNQYNAWWVADLQYAFADEMKRRFSEVPDMPEVGQLQGWLKRGLLRNLPKPDQCVIDEFPLTIPEKYFVKEAVHNKVMVAYQNYYAMALKGKHRMKWTTREVPAFMDLPF